MKAVQFGPIPSLMIASCCSAFGIDANFFEVYCIPAQWFLWLSLLLQSLCSGLRLIREKVHYVPSPAHMSLSVIIGCEIKFRNWKQVVSVPKSENNLSINILRVYLRVLYLELCLDVVHSSLQMSMRSTP